MNGARPGAAATIALGLVFSALAALPAWLRSATAVQWLPAAAALTGAVSVPVVTIALWLRRAKGAGFPAADRALLCAAGLSALPLALLAGVLKSTTHHRPLGGATFAVAAACVLALSFSLCFRVFGSQAGLRLKSAWPNLSFLGCGLSLLGVIVLASARAGRGALLDFLALMSAAALAGLLEPPRSLGRLRLSAVLVGWVLLLALALLSLKTPQLARVLAAQAQVSFAPLSWLGDGS